MRALTIGVDASRAFVPRPTGTERYSTSLIRELVKLEPHRFILYHRWPPEVATPDDAELRVIPSPRFWTHLGLSKALFADPPDALFVPAHVLPIRLPRIATVVTVHDLGYRHFPDAHPLTRRLYLDLTTRRHARLGTRVIAISEATRDDLVNLYGADPGRIRVVHLAADEDMRPADAEAIDGARQAVELDSETPYVLAVATVQPRKNLRRLIFAFARVAATRPAVRLVIAGAPGWGRENLAALAASLGIGNRVRIAGYVDRSLLIGLYGGATVVAVPSLYEGFGLPVLEAMACGAPVLTTTGGSLPEIAGDAALIVDPLDIEHMARGLGRLLDDPNCREDLSRRGRARAAEFSWARAARETLAVIEEAAAVLGKR